MLYYSLEAQEGLYCLSYADLRKKHEELCNLSDDDFLIKLPEALHLACVICFLKEIPSDYCLSDKGIIHELVHLLHIPDGNTTTLKEIRTLFQEQLHLSF